MTDDPDLFWFGCVLTLICFCFTFSLVSQHSRTFSKAHTRLVANSALVDSAVDTNITELQQIIELQQQCVRLRAELQRQKAQVYEDFQQDSFTQLQPLLTNYPSACKMAQAKPDLPACNLVALFTPLATLLETWQITSIGLAWEQVPFDAQKHQPDSNEIATGELVYIRFVGYSQGDRILVPAKVSRTLPGGIREGSKED